MGRSWGECKPSWIDVIQATEKSHCSDLSQSLIIVWGRPGGSGGRRGGLQRRSSCPGDRVGLRSRGKSRRRTRDRDWTARLRDRQKGKQMGWRCRWQRNREVGGQPGLWEGKKEARGMVRQTEGKGQRNRGQMDN